LKTISKFFTPALTSSEKISLADLLGVNDFRFLYHEKSGGHPLFSHLFNVPNCYVAALREDDLDYWLYEKALDFVMVVDQKGTRLPSLSSQCFSETLGLWEALMPFPLSLFPLKNKLAGDLSIRIFPELAEAELHQLVDSFKEFEVKLSHCEAALLWVESGESRFPILLHFVRKKLMRVGTSARLFDLGYRFEAGQLGQEQLDEAMGTRSLFVPLHVAQTPGESALQSLSAAISRALLHFVDDAAALIAPRLSSNEPTGMASH